MASTSTTYGEMFKSMKGLEISRSVKKLLRHTGKTVNTWGQVDALMQEEQRFHRLYRFKTYGSTAKRLLRKLQLFYEENEARKASMKQGLTGFYRPIPIFNIPRASTKDTKYSQGSARKGSGKKGTTRKPMRGHGGPVRPPALGGTDTLLDGSFTAPKPVTQSASVWIGLAPGQSAETWDNSFW